MKFWRIFRKWLQNLANPADWKYRDEAQEDRNIIWRIKQLRENGELKSGAPRKPRH